MDLDPFETRLIKISTLYLAVKHGRIETCRLLLKLGAIPRGEIPSNFLSGEQDNMGACSVS